MRYVVAVLLLLLAAFCATTGIMLLSNLLTADYLDSPASTFVLIGVFLVAIAVAIAARALESIWSRRPRALMAIMLGGSATAFGTAFLGIFVGDGSLWQPVTLAAAVATALMLRAPAWR